MRQHRYPVVVGVPRSPGDLQQVFRYEGEGDSSKSVGVYLSLCGSRRKFSRTFSKSVGVYLSLCGSRRKFTRTFSQHGGACLTTLYIIAQRSVCACVSSALYELEPHGSWTILLEDPALAFAGGSVLVRLVREQW